MVPGESSYPDGSEYVGQRGVFKVELRAAEVDPLFEICRDLFAVSQKITTFVFLVRLLGNGKFFVTSLDFLQHDRFKSAPCGA